LRVANKYTYHDLDELIVSHINATVRKIDELMNHDKFKGRSQEELRASRRRRTPPPTPPPLAHPLLRLVPPRPADSFLRNYTMANPGKSIYGFGLNRERPGYFDLAFLSKPTTEGGVIQTWVRASFGVSPFPPMTDTPSLGPPCTARQGQPGLVRPRRG